MSYNRTSGNYGSFTNMNSFDYYCICTNHYIVINSNWFSRSRFNNPG